jgi:hypothetical protein
MAIPKIKATYSLDEDTVRLLEKVAERWGVSKSEALRRAIRAAADSEAARNPALQTLTRIQDSLGLTTAVAAAWARQRARSGGRAVVRPLSRDSS